MDAGRLATCYLPADMAGACGSAPRRATSACACARTDVCAATAPGYCVEEPRSCTFGLRGTHCDAGLCGSCVALLLDESVRERLCLVCRGGHASVGSRLPCSAQHAPTHTQSMPAPRACLLPSTLFKAPPLHVADRCMRACVQMHAYTRFHTYTHFDTRTHAFTDMHPHTHTQLPCAAPAHTDALPSGALAEIACLGRAQAGLSLTGSHLEPQVRGCGRGGKEGRLMEAGTGRRLHAQACACGCQHVLAYPWRVFVLSYVWWCGCAYGYMCVCARVCVGMGGCGCVLWRQQRVHMPAWHTRARPLPHSAAQPLRAQVHGLACPAPFACAGSPPPLVHHPSPPSLRGCCRQRCVCVPLGVCMTACRPPLERLAPHVIWHCLFVRPPAGSAPA